MGAGKNRLPRRAVGAQVAQDLAGQDGEDDVVHYRDAAEALSELADFEHDVN
jgi:hypothetical protein